MVVPVGADVAVNATLEVGNVTRAGDGDSGAREGQRADSGIPDHDHVGQQLTELPTLTRNPYDLVALAGNVQDGDSEETLLVGGDRPGHRLQHQRRAHRPARTSCSTAATTTTSSTASVGQEVPLDAVQEFSVITNNFSAQYGRATGGIVNVVTKSGTNIFRGTVYEFFRNEKLANNSPDNEANDIEKGQFKRNQTGYSLGGPIVKDKVHFFSSLEYIGVRSTRHADLLGADAAVPRGDQSRDARRTSMPTARA